MLMNFFNSVNQVYQIDILEYIQSTFDNPGSMILTVIDLAIVVTLIFYACKMLKNTRAWQLLKGIFILVLVTIISNMLRLKILNYILLVNKFYVTRIPYYRFFCYIKNHNYLLLW